LKSPEYRKTGFGIAGIGNTKESIFSREHGVLRRL
jgi:hypothetical protein